MKYCLQNQQKNNYKRNSEENYLASLFLFNLLNQDPHISQDSGFSNEQTIAAVCSSIVL
jgi:hypothetical protein